MFLTLPGQADLWGTPKANEDNKSPEAHLAMKQRMGGGGTKPTSLNVVAKLWATPRSSPNENRGMGAPPSHGQTHGNSLIAQVNDPSFLPAPTTTTDGPPTSTPVALHPPFVEALMGLPVGWTDCLSPATESYRLWLRRHSAALSTVLTWYSDLDHVDV